MKSTIIVILLLLLSCNNYSQTREDEILYFMENLLTACNENDIEKFYSNFNEFTLGDFDTNTVKNDIKEVYYVLHKFNGKRIDDLAWTTNNVVNTFGMVQYDVNLFQGFDSLTGYTKVMISFYFWSPEYGRVKGLGTYKLNIDVDSKYRGFLRRNNQLLDADELLNAVDR